MKRIELAIVAAFVLMSTAGCEQDKSNECIFGEAACTASNEAMSCTENGTWELVKKCKKCLIDEFETHAYCYEDEACAVDCINGCDEDTGICICPENCKGHCNKDGSCQENIPSSCKGKNCAVGCDEETGTCICHDSCKDECDTDGSCLNVQNCLYGTNKDETCLCNEKCPDVCNSNGSCIDSNQNHMIDSFEIVQAKSCKVHQDCDSAPGSGDGFCDSFIGNHCATKCSNDAQCMPDEHLYGSTFHYVCRTDGRCAPDTFETVWKTTNDDHKVVIHLHNAKTCSFDIDWDDEQNTDDNKHISSCADDLAHEYSIQGEHHIKIKGTLDGWRVTDTNTDNYHSFDADASKLKEVVSFGPVRLDHHTFVYASSLRRLSRIDIPDSTTLTSLSYAFHFATNYGRDSQLTDYFDKWDTSNVTDMSYMFEYASYFNKNIADWNTSNVTNMSYMFAYTERFNDNIGKWNTSNVTTMEGMFEFSKSFNQNIENWNTSNVTNFHAMFYKATSFNHPLENWNTSSVTNMMAMFSQALAFNQDISHWNTSSVTNMDFMFAESPFDHDLSEWKLPKIKNLNKVFYKSKISEANFCKLITTGISTWAKNLENLNSDYQCQTEDQKQNNTLNHIPKHRH